MVISALLAAAVGLQHVRDRLYPIEAVEDDLLYFTSAETVGRMALEFRPVVADLYWIRSLQYYGGIQRALRTGQSLSAPTAQYASLFPLLDLTTSLDPRLGIAYRFGAIFLAEPPLGGPGRPDLAIRLLEKGLAARPDKWEYMEDIGFVHYWYDRDYMAASAAFQKASEMADAPIWLRPLAAATLAKGGDRQSSRTMWRAIRATAELDWLKQNADRVLLQLDALDAIDALQRGLDRYATQTGRHATSWTALALAGAIRAVPVDPVGTPFELTPEGRVILSKSSPLWPLPREINSSEPPS